MRAGYTPFYFNFFTDHRGMIIDLDIEIVFYYNHPDTNRPIYKCFTTLHIPKMPMILTQVRGTNGELEIFSAGG